MSGAAAVTMIDTVRRHIKDMLEARGDDVSYIEEHGDVVEPSRYYSELIELGTDRTTVLFALSKKVLTEWRQGDVDAEEMIAAFGGTRNFVLVLADPPSSQMMQYIDAKDKELQAKGGMLQVFYLKELMYNPLKHELVPKHEKLTEEEVKEVLERYLVKHKSQMPAISRNDAVARRLGLRHGDVVRITRYNDTSGEYYYYRSCV